jgi:DNA-binding MarR family transcriptional regulator
VTSITETTTNAGRTGRGVSDASTSAQWTPLPALLDDLVGHSFAEFHTRMQEAGHGSIRQGHGCVFRFIHEGGSRLTDLAESSGLSKQAVGEVVDNLEALGYVERAQDPQDGRAKVIKLTKRGADAQHTALGIFDDIERQWKERYGAERVATMRQLLEEITAG